MEVTSSSPQGALGTTIGREESTQPEELEEDTSEEQSPPEEQSPDQQSQEEPKDHSKATPNIEELRHPPPHLAYMRQKLFEVRDRIELKSDEFDRYWPFVDNVWVRQHKASLDKIGHRTTEYWACRLQRPTYMPRRSNEPRPDGKPLRKKQTREGGTCRVRIKTVRCTGVHQIISISGLNGLQHSHDLDHMDQIKRNTVLMEIARAEVMKGFMPASVFTVIHDQAQNLNAAGGRHLSRNDVRNASQTWRQHHRGPLGVHPGYKYDHGNGIVRAPSSSTSDRRRESPTPIDNLLHPLPPSTLFFPPKSRAFLTPYLPPQSVPLAPGALPHVTLTYATSMDSFLAIQPGMPTALSGATSKAMTHYLRSCHDAILIGVGTALADDPSLNCRLAGAGGFGGLGWEYQPRPIIIDPGARWLLSPDRAVIRTAARGQGLAPWIIISPGFAMDPVRLDFARHYGGKYLGMPSADAAYRLRWDGIFRALAAEGIRSVLVEGGGVVINELLQPRHASLIASVIVTIAPRYLGAGGVAVCPPRNVDAVGRPVPVVAFRNVSWTQLGEDVVMCGRVRATTTTTTTTTTTMRETAGEPEIETESPSKLGSELAISTATETATETATAHRTLGKRKPTPSAAAPEHGRLGKRKRDPEPPPAQAEHDGVDSGIGVAPFGLIGPSGRCYGPLNGYQA